MTVFFHRIVADTATPTGDRTDSLCSGTLTGSSPSRSITPETQLRAASSDNTVVAADVSPDSAGALDDQGTASIHSDADVTTSSSIHGDKAYCDVVHAATLEVAPDVHESEGEPDDFFQHQNDDLSRDSRTTERLLGGFPHASPRRTRKGDASPRSVSDATATAEEVQSLLPADSQTNADDVSTETDEQEIMFVNNSADGCHVVSASSASPDTRKRLRVKCDIVEYI